MYLTRSVKSKRSRRRNIHNVPRPGRPKSVTRRPSSQALRASRPRTVMSAGRSYRRRRSKTAMSGGRSYRRRKHTGGKKHKKRKTKSRR